ncbi:MAG: sigma-54-dependent Fis family transcriptional regulator [Bdellovibrionales bacterium]|nr:sigma-54-dependent Fis family transcriptional regulator [Bdellovibrionales bacterium]
MSRWWVFFWLLLAAKVSFASSGLPSRVAETCAEESIAGRVAPFEMVGESEAMQQVRRLIERVAPHKSSVLILGESGTGKELVADAIHALSSRRGKPFEALNVSALNPSLLESELFGHEKGAYTGADRQRKGLFERAEGGTLFLDELGEMPLDMQAKLLRVLEGHSFTRVGGSQLVRPNVRLIFATNRDLADRVREGLFREDLFFRISVVPIELPPLRERGEDIARIAHYFLKTLGPSTCSAVGCTLPEKFSRAAQERLMAHRWTGNVRELRNVVERTLIFLPHGTTVIEPEHLDLRDLGFGGDEAPLVRALNSLRMGALGGRTTKWSEIECQLLAPYVKDVLQRHNWVKRHAATALGLTVSDLTALIERLGIRRFGDRT